MKFCLYCFLASFAWSTASPLPQQELPENTSLSATPLPAPIANAAIWHEAVAADASLSASAGSPVYTNQKVYALLEFMQNKENASNGAVPADFDPSSSTSYTSQGLEAINAYPEQFSQAQTLNPATTPIEITSTPEQTIKSFGASGAWWPNDVKFFPPEQQQNLSQLLFSEDFLYLSGYRYNMGASGEKDNVTINYPRGVESFMQSDGTYDFTRDSQGIYFLRAAEAANVSSITFFVNAAPSGLQATSKDLSPCGGSLDESAIPNFVAYIVAVLSHWADNGITIEYISPMNEPDDNFFLCNQEGMSVISSIRSKVFQQLRAGLAASNSAGMKSVKIMGDETSQIVSQALREYGDWLPETLAQQAIDAIAVHMYDWPDDATLLNYGQLIKNSSSITNQNPPVKMTEISSFKTALGNHTEWGWTGPKIMGPEFDPSISNALDMARMIWQWLTLVNAESFDWWVAVSSMLPCSPTANASCTTAYNGTWGWNDGLIYIAYDYATTHNYNFYLTKRFWVFKHFTTFFRPGSVRYDIPNEVLPYGTVAIAALDADVWNTIFINRNNTAQDITIKLPATGGKVIGVTQTTDAEDWQSMALPSVSAHDTISLNLPARAVVSIQFTVTGPISARQVEEQDFVTQSEGETSGVYQNWGSEVRSRSKAAHKAGSISG